MVAEWRLPIKSAFTATIRIARILLAVTLFNLLVLATHVTALRKVPFALPA